MLDEGRGGQADYSRAARLLLDARKAGSSAAKYNLAGDMSSWDGETRLALKRELKLLGFHDGTGGSAWTDAERKAVEDYAEQGK